MAELSERHEVRLRGRGHTIVFVADSSDGRLVIRQEPDGGDGREVCAITLSDPEELRGFFDGLRRVLASLPGGEAASPPLESAARAHRRSPRAIELRLQRMGVLPPERPS